jgi:hypothetical protein
MTDQAPNPSRPGPLRAVLITVLVAGLPLLGGLVARYQKSVRACYWARRWARDLEGLFEVLRSNAESGGVQDASERECLREMARELAADGEFCLGDKLREMEASEEDSLLAWRTVERQLDPSYARTVMKAFCRQQPRVFYERVRRGPKDAEEVWIFEEWCLKNLQVIGHHAFGPHNEVPLQDLRIYPEPAAPQRPEAAGTVEVPACSFRIGSFRFEVRASWKLREDKQGVARWALEAPGGCAGCRPVAEVTRLPGTWQPLGPRP